MTCKALYKAVEKYDVTVIGLGGFAVFWFVIRKKTWADFMAAVKGVFAKKQ